MAKGRKPEGDQPLTGAERQARYRARHARAPVVRLPTSYRPPQPSSTPGTMRSLNSSPCRAITPNGSTSCLNRCATLPTGEALHAVIDFDLDDLVALEPPRGFGRD
jgi:hypothetical protein